MLVYFPNFEFLSDKEKFGILMSTDYVKYTAEFLYKSYNIRRSNMYNQIWEGTNNFSVVLNLYFNELWLISPYRAGCFILMDFVTYTEWICHIHQECCKTCHRNKQYTTMLVISPLWGQYKCWWSQLAPVYYDLVGRCPTWLSKDGNCLGTDPRASPRNSTVHKLQNGAIS